MNCALEFTFSLHYKFKRPIEIDDVINPLKGIKAILPKTRYILKEYDQLNAPKDVQCYIKEIKAGSLWDDIVVKFIFGSEEAKDKWIKSLRDKLGITAMNNKFPILSPIISSIIVCSVTWMLMRGDDEAVKNSIVFGDYAKITIASTSEQLKLPEERLHKILKTIAENPSMARACCNLVEPAKKAGESAELILDETQHIPPEIIAMIPNAYTLNNDEILTQDLTEVKIDIRALDFDRKNAWRGKVCAVSDKRLPIIIPETIDIETIPPGESTVDVTMEYTVDEDGNRKYQKAYLRKIYKEQ